ncbi:MAG TPA: hypothetical protein VLC74_14365, partial [Rhizomicrobium sp.]|nr:hypothetical protein [Rhizomicrobium sp.]
NGKRTTVPLTIAEDPRVNVTLADLQASLALSQKIAPAMAAAALGYREQHALKKLLDVRFPQARKVREEMRGYLGQLRTEPAENQPTFESVADMLAGVERALESADTAPTPAQRQFVDDALAKLAAVQREWDAAKSGSLAHLNAALASAGEKPVTIPEKDKLQVEEPDEGQDLP